MPILPGSYGNVTFEQCREALADLMRCDKVPDRFGRNAAIMLETQALKRAEAICDDFYNRGRLAIFCGPSGSGKSFAAYALACLGYLRHDFSFHGFESQLFFAMAWNDETKAIYNDAWSGDRTLILDDLGSESASTRGTLEANLYAGLNHRYAECLPTIITSNFGLDELTSLYPDFSDRLKSRFAEWAVVVELNVSDLRLRGDVAPETSSQPQGRVLGAWPRLSNLGRADGPENASLDKGTEVEGEGE